MASPFATATSLREYRRILDNGFDPNEASVENGTTAIFHLWRDEEHVDYPQVVQLLVQHGADLDHVDDTGNTALLRSESDALSLALIQAGASISELRPSNFETSSAIVAAAKKGHINTIKHLVENMGVSVDTYHGRGTTIHHVLYSSSLVLEECGAAEGLTSIVRYTADVDQRDFMGRTPLFLVYESVRCAEILLNGGADPNRKIPRGFWFHREIFDEYVAGECGEGFIDAAMQNGKSWESLIHSVHTRSPEVTRLMLERGAYVDSVDSDGNSALLRLLSYGSVSGHTFEVLNILLEYGASCTLRNKDGKAAADMPLYQHESVRWLIDQKAMEQKWLRKREFFLVIARYKCAHRDSSWKEEGGVLKMLASKGYSASQDFIRNIVEYL